MSMINNPFRRICLIIVISFFIAMTGCERTETGEKVNDTVETFAGKKSVDQMKKMKKDIEDIQDRQDDRLKQLGE
ncbi:MAG: hypothetical protein WC560_09730 [Syntrophales bacterium]